MDSDLSRRVIMKKILFCLFILILVLILFVIRIESQASREIPSSPVIEDHIFGQHIKFKSRSLGEEKSIFIYLPESYKRKPERYPVCYILDRRSYFVPFAGIVKYLSLYDLIPEMIVVAVASGDRLKEFTYTKANEKTHHT